MNQVSPLIGNTFRGLNQYRPNVVPGVPMKLISQNPANGFINYVNPAAFSFPVSGIAALPQSPFGNSPRNPLRNPAFYQTDLALNKKFSTPIDGLKVEFRGEFYNLLNHTNLYLPSSSNITGTIGVTNSLPAAAAPTGAPPHQQHL